MITRVQDFFGQQWLHLKKDKYSMALFFIVLVGGLGMGIVKGKAWYVARKESAAQVTFADAYEEYRQALQALLQKDDAGKVEAAIKDALLNLESVEELHGSSVYSMYTHALKADLCAQEKKYDQALVLLEKALTKMGTSSPVYYMYKTKQALILCDAGQADKGVALLEELAQDTQNKQADTAAFYLGSYYWSEKQYDKAKAAWKMFEAPLHQKEPQKNSPWSYIVATKLAQCA